MNYVKSYGVYKIWYFPRLHIYRASTEKDPQLYLHFNHTRDFKTIDDVINAIGLRPQSNFSYTDPYNVAIQWLKQEGNKNNEYYKEIEVLIGQYYYGIEPKKELRNRLLSMGLLTK